MSDYRALMRRKLLEEMYDKLSEDEKRQFVMLTMQEKDHREIMEALNLQQDQIGRVARKIERQSWMTDYGSDVAANFLTDGLIWLGAKLLRR